MESKRARLDRFLWQKLNSHELKNSLEPKSSPELSSHQQNSRHEPNMSRKSLRLVVAQGRVRLNGEVTNDVAALVDEFTHVEFDGKVLQDNQPYYLMLHKPVGVVSATTDEQHQTVIDLIDKPYAKQLHIVGRLDLNTSGLVLLTNDGRWSRQLTSPTSKVNKCYCVTLADPITGDNIAKYCDGFAKGFYFEYEDITTAPATLEVVGTHQAKVTLTEGKYHQIKRMFGRYQNRVVGLHRESIGGLELDVNLRAGESRELTRDEIKLSLQEL